MRVSEIMTPDPEVVDANDTVSHAAQLMRDFDIGIVPVVDGNGGRLRGVITDRDIAVRHVAEGHGNGCTVSDHMSEGVTTASPDDDVRDVMARMQDEQVRRIPVVGDDERLVGIVAQADLAVEVGPEAEDEVEETVEKISEPAEPKR